jgi:hypothetical protein
MRRPSGRGYFAWGAGVAAAIAFLGFARTYYLKRWFGSPTLPSIVHVHAAVMTSWLALFGVQVGLIARGRTDLHRRLGVAGALLAAVMVLLGLYLAAFAAHNGVTREGFTPEAFMAIPATGAVVFAIFITLGIASRDRPEFHKRYMLLATLSAVLPAVARIVDDAVGFWVPGIVILSIATSASFVIWDTLKHGMVHRAFRWGMPIFVLSLPARIFIGSTHAWQEFAAWAAASVQ